MKISVCVPVLNAASFLRETLRSIAIQTRLPEEIVVTDNGSTDNSLEEIYRFQTETPNIAVTIVRHETPLGMSADWNRTVSYAKHPLVMLLPSDDILAPTALERHYDSLNESPTTVAFTASAKHLITSSGFRLPGSIARMRRGIHHFAECGATILCSAENRIGEPGCVVFRKAVFDAVSGFDHRLQYYPDLDLWFRMLRRGDFCFIDKPLVGFRVHSGSLTGPNQALAFCEWAGMYNRYYKTCGLPPNIPWNLRMRTHCVNYARCLVFFLLTFKKSHLMSRIIPNV